MAIDPAPLWDFSKPEVSEQRFRAALETATGDDALVLQTQIARTYGLRRDFSTAQDILRSVAKDIPTACSEVRTRYGLELGRTYASASRYVYEELEILYRAQDNESRARHYAELRESVPGEAARCH
jgi:hypothetical protein